MQYRTPFHDPEQYAIAIVEEAELQSSPGVRALTTIIGATSPGFWMFIIFDTIADIVDSISEFVYRGRVVEIDCLPDCDLRQNDWCYGPAVEYTDATINWYPNRDYQG